MTRKPRYVCKSVLLLICFSTAYATQHLIAQQLSSKAATTEAPDWATAGNRWRLIPADQASQIDTVSPEVRKLRNDAVIPLLQVVFSGRGSVDGGSGDPDIVAKYGSHNLTWVVATFSNYKVYSATGRGDYLYTELSFDVSRTVAAPNTQISPQLCVRILGGKLRTPDNVVHSSTLEPEYYSHIPNHKYLLAYYAETDGTIVVVRSWDVTNGEVVVSSTDDELKLRSGQTELIGKTLESAISLVQSKLISQQ